MAVTRAQTVQSPLARLANPFRKPPFNRPLSARRSDRNIAKERENNRKLPIQSSFDFKTTPLLTGGVVRMADSATTQDIPALYARESKKAGRFFRGIDEQEESAAISGENRENRSGWPAGDR